MLNLEMESSEHLRWAYLEQVQHCTDLPRQVTFPAHRAGKDGAMVGMNAVAHLEKKKNEERKAGKRKAGEGRRQVTDYKEAVCCPTVVIQGAALQKNEEECLG